MVLAQAATTTSGVATSSNSGVLEEDSNDDEATRQDRTRRYRRQSGDIEQKIAALGDTIVTSVRMPILFGVQLGDITPNFGDPRSGGRTHKGEDILATKGTPIVSPVPAVVLRVGVGELEGNSVYTATSGGETFIYIHLDRVGEGVVPGLVLGQGSLIGYVGDTGNAAGGPAHLHFEIHNNAGVAIDPFPRLLEEFTLQEKINYVTVILNQNSDPVTLARFLVTNFRNTFTSAQAANVILPASIIEALSFVPITATPTTRIGSTLPAGELDIGSSGELVIALQKYLIQKASGPKATTLSQAGATGYFGPITKAALAEYQLVVGITPASGYYGPKTLAFINSHPLSDTIPPSVASTTTTALSRDLLKGMSGEDIRTLQKLLNVNAYTVATSGPGSPGNETVYFGPATEAAVIQFQKARNIKPAAGYVGPLTRAALALL